MVDDEIYQFKQASDWLSDYKKKINIQPDPVKFECNQECNACKLI